MNARELIEFGRTHVTAGEFLTTATDDYVGCRCCLLSGLFCGLRLGAEAVEKCLKAFILFADPSQDVKNYSHRIRHLASTASALEPRFNAAPLAEIIDRLETHYRNRYPERDLTRSASTGELAGIDDLVTQIWDCLPIPEGPKFRNYGYFFFVCCPWPAVVMNPYRKWLEQENAPLQRVRASLVQRYQAVEEKLKQA